jgi:hypothetical protein
MKTIIAILIAVFIFTIIYKLDTACFVRKDKVIWEIDGVKVIENVKVYECGAE